MKTIKTMLLLIVTSTALIAQSNTFRSRLTISPSYAIGWTLPPKIESGSTSLLLQPQFFRNHILGEVEMTNGEKRQVYRITNNMGVDLNYTLTKRLSANVGVNRFLQVNTLSDPDAIQLNYGYKEYISWIYLNQYYTFSTGLRLKRYDRFFQCNVHYATQAKNVFSENNDGSSGVVTNGNGLTGVITNYKTNTFLISPEYGISGMSSLDFPIDLSVGLTIPTSYFSKQTVTFVRSGANAGNNYLTFRQTGIWFRARVPITIWVSTKDKKKKEPAIPLPKPKKIVIYEGKKIEKGEKVVLKAIQFEQAKSVLTPLAMQELDKLDDLMSQSETMVIEITGHTSDEGDRNSNIDLSLQRAKACKAYLVKKGIKSNRIQVRGMGPDAPISRTDKSLNRRVEMQIISM